MKKAYRELKFHAATLKLLGIIDAMITDYTRQGYTLSVRQLYYQLVARALIPNTDTSYKRIADTINNGRLAGLLDWDAIEDRNRDVVKRAAWTSGGQILQSCASQFHMDLWAGQESRPFVVVEKAALAGVLERTCHTHDVPLLAARGYPSVSIVRELALQYFMPAVRAGQEVVVLHLGDHDPSGLDMTRDLVERIEMFMDEEGYAIEVRRLALNRNQIEKYNPPPNPAKMTDARFAEYRKVHGVESWELDALEPAVLANLVQGEIRAYIDDIEWQARKDEIQDVKDRLQKLADNF